MIKIENNDIAQYISSSRNCVNNVVGYTIKPQNGKLNLDLSSFFSYKYCELVLKRASGNGSVNINANKYSTLSKISQNIKIDISNNKKIQIIRDDAAIGDIILLSFTLLNDEQTVEYQSLVDIKKSLKLCGPYFSITNVGQKIIAHCGAKIDNGLLIDQIITEPPNIATLGSNVTFNAQCEILNIILKENINLNVSYLSNRLSTAANSNLNLPQELKTNNSQYVVDAKYREYKNIKQVSRMSNEIKLSLATIKDYNDVYENSVSSLLLRHKGQFSIPTSNIDPYWNYILKVKAVKVNGNGKLGFQVQTRDAVISKKVVVCSNELTDQYLFFDFPGPNDPNNPFFISVFRPEGSSSGDIIVSSVDFSKCDTPKARSNNYSPAPSNKSNYYAPKQISIISNESNSWKLSIPKNAHFYWGGNLSFLRYVSIYSFIKLNPDWKVKLHVPEIVGDFKTPWKTNEQTNNVNTRNHADNYLDKLYGLNLEVVKHNFENYKFRNEEHEVHKSDFLRWKLLAEEGGLWSDSDIIYTHPMICLQENREENRLKPTMVCTLPATADQSYNNHAIGFLMSSGNNAFFNSVFGLAKTKFNRRAYQSIGSEILNKNFAKLADNNRLLYLNSGGVYTFTDSNIHSFLSKEIYIQDYDSAIGFHWYGGSSIVADIEGTMNHTNYKTFNNFLGKLVQHILI